MREFFREIVHALEAGGPVALVSVVSSEGSTPRGAGAMLAVFPGGAIAGTITTLVGTGLTPMAGAKITLKDSNGAVVASTYSADDGEFLFYDVADGLYTMLASAEGYLTSAPMAVTITGGSIANVTMSLTVDTRTYNGTVSGVIRDQKGTAVAGCFVGLYQITGTGAGATETLIATTKTNAEGKYLFGGVVGGQYLVKAKLEQ